MQRRLIIGILAHVDAGKTTLSEALLYLSGRIRTQGRVDHGTTYLDSNPIERERGITVFSKQARFSRGDCDFVLLDTPGHVDFSAETERTLAMLDYAILLVSAADGVQNHTRTLWQLLDFYQVPTLLFVNKTDLALHAKEELARQLADTLSPCCIPFYEKDTPEERGERLALVCESFLDHVLAGSPIPHHEIADRIAERRLFPILFGAALRMEGVEHLLDVLADYTLTPSYSSDLFGGRVYKIAYAGGLRLTYLKVSSGCLSVRDEITYLTPEGSTITEKAAQLRLYSGDRFEQVEQVSAGEIVAVAGLSRTTVGAGLGIEANAPPPLLEPVLSYSIRLPKECDPVLWFSKLKPLEEEEPTLHLRFNNETGEIEARLMGEIQTELLQRMILERFSIPVTLGTGRILYKERVASRTLGVGHFEPLRHYAEVQLLLEPKPKGTGLVFESRLAEGGLDLNWQRLILSHLYEKDHRGTAIGAALTDTQITLVAGKAHLKHTEGGDFREATLRAVRQGLMKAGCVLLEPFYRFRLELPREQVGRATTDLGTRAAEFTIAQDDGAYATLTGRGPVSTLAEYPRELLSYTRGKGRIFLQFDGYDPCHNAEEIINAAGYDPAADLDNPPHSVFCSHGAGVIVPWDEVDAHKHIALSLHEETPAPRLPSRAAVAKKYRLSDDELEALMLREFGPIKRRRYSEPRRNVAPTKEKPHKPKPTPARDMLILDGYNVIWAWEDLAQVATVSLEKARQMLMDLLSSYVAFTKIELLLVFDAYLVKEGTGNDFTHDGYRVVYTKENQTADAYIEQVMHRLGPDYRVRLVTADRLLQFSAVHAGILRMTPKEFEEEVRTIRNEITAFLLRLRQENK